MFPQLCTRHSHSGCPSPTLSVMRCRYVSNDPLVLLFGLFVPHYIAQFTRVFSRARGTHVVEPFLCYQDPRWSSQKSTCRRWHSRSSLLRKILHSLLSLSLSNAYLCHTPVVICLNLSSKFPALKSVWHKKAMTKDMEAGIHEAQITSLFILLTAEEIIGLLLIEVW